MKLFKKLNKGFTLVELVVVIAVIAILSAVSVVAYTGITKNANKSAAMQNARSAYEAYLVDESQAGRSVEDIDIHSGEYWFIVEGGQFNTTAQDSDTRAEVPNFNIGSDGKLTPAA